MFAERVPVVIFSHDEVAAAVDRLASEIETDLRGKNPLIICILKGSFIFTADLVRRLDFPLEVDFVRVSSYGSGTESSGEIRVGLEVSTPLEGRDALLIEDIVDTGRTTSFLLGHLRQQRPASLRLCSLLEKPLRREVPVEIDYLGFTVPNKFIVGYGIDWDERLRYLPDVCYLEED